MTECGNWKPRAAIMPILPPADGIGSRYFNTLRPRKMAAFQMTFSNVFSWIKIYEFRFEYRWNTFLGAQHWFKWRLGAYQAISHYLNQWWLVYWRIYSSVGPNEQTQCHIENYQPIWLMSSCGQWKTLFGARAPGGRLNKKDGLTRYGDSHVKDKTS